MAIHWNTVPEAITISCCKDDTRAQTILRVICLVIFFLHTCYEWTLSMSRVLLCHPTRFRKNREKRDPYGWRTWVHRRSNARPAGTVMFRGKRREVRLSLTSIDGSSLTWSEVSSEIRLAYKIWTTHLLPSSMLSPPVNRGALRCIADLL